jgi:glycyl-tRNA synthetase
VVKNEVLCYFMALAVKFIEELGIPWEKQRLREVPVEERAHYSSQTFDQEVWLERWGWTEVSGHAYRTDYDLRNHMAHSSVDLRVHKMLAQPRKERSIEIKPRIEVLRAELGEESAQRVALLVRRSEPTIIERELREKGFYEITGQPSVRIEPRHVDISYRDVEVKGRYFVPHVVEPSFGVDRIVYALLEYAYEERGDRVVLKIPRDISPTKVAVFPLVNKDKLPEKARYIADMLIQEGFIVNYDASGSIGRRYARADEVGTPVCMTVDYKSLEDESVTLRDLFTWKQVRADINRLPLLMRDYLGGRLEFQQLGSSVSEQGM